MCKKSFILFIRNLLKTYEMDSEINYSTNIISLNFYLDSTEPSGLGINLSMLDILIISFIYSSSIR